MSALQRTRSRSTTPPATGADVAPPNGMTSVLDNDRSLPTSTPSPSRVAAQRAASAPRQSPLKQDTTSLKPLPAARLPIKSAVVGETVGNKKDVDEDHPDNRSSSLSELGDGSDEHDEPTPRPVLAADFAENDSEAETERLENTPRKLTRTATDISVASDHTVERTPSKLAHSNILDREDSRPLSPLAAASLGDPADGDASLGTPSLVAGSDIGSVAELASRKRKRSTTENSSVDEPAGAPARKRSGTAKSPIVNGSQVTLDHDPEPVDVEEELDHAEERISELAHEEVELEQRQANIAAETVSELSTVARLTKPKRGGGRKGKRKAEDVGDTNSEILTHVDTVEVDIEADQDEDDSSALDEEVSKKKAAIESLSRLEKKFRIFREKVCDEKIANCERELEMLKQPNCVHPEYLNMVRCIDERRDEKIECEKTLLNYKQRCLEIRTIAERQQMHSQYIQAVREIRERDLNECNQRVYELQRSRRQLGVEDIDYSIKFPEKRSEQIRQQAAYNQEVGILAGIAKYVGFPAAPDMAPARPADIEDDLRAMKIITRHPPPLPYVRQYNRTSTADEAAAEEQFIERTPWANPQHPAHHQSHYPAVPVGLSRPPAQSYHTPAGQRRVVDVHATNGSASTIDVMSNPPSSTAAQGLLTDANRQQSESPVLRMKRHPNDNRVQPETPGSQPRNFTTLARESYPSNQHMGSSPATGHVDQPHHEYDSHSAAMAGRWGGNAVRPLNAGPPSIPAGAPLPGRPEAGRIPIPQRSSLGTVSVGSGSGLFGR